MESSKRSSRRSGSSFHISGWSRPRSSVCEAPSQSCPSPPVLTSQHDPQPRDSKKPSSSSQKQGSSSSTSKKTNSKSHRKEYLAISNNEPQSESGSEKEEVSITNNLSEIFHNKRDIKSSKSGKISEIYLARTEFTPSTTLPEPSPTSCDLDICDKPGDFAGCMPTLHNFSGNDIKYLYCSIINFIDKKPLRCQSACQPPKILRRKMMTPTA